MTFVNKVDREGRDPFEIMDEVADQLALDVAPMVWPLGTGARFKGCYDLTNDRVATLSDDDSGRFDKSVQLTGPDDSKLDEIVGKDDCQEARDLQGRDHR